MLGKISRKTLNRSQSSLLSFRARADCPSPLPPPHPRACFSPPRAHISPRACLFSKTRESLNWGHSRKNPKRQNDDSQITDQNWKGITLVDIQKQSSQSSASKKTAIADMGIRAMLDHYELLCQKLFNTILDDPCHKLRAILPPLHDDSRYNLRKQHHCNMSRLRTDRTKNTFIFAMSRKFNWKFS